MLEKNLKWNCEDGEKCFLELKSIDFTPYNDLLRRISGRNIKFMDIDGAVEYDNKFLFLEAKSIDNISDKKGQRWFFERLAYKLKKDCLVIYYWHDKDDKYFIKCLSYHFNEKWSDKEFFVNKQSCIKRMKEIIENFFKKEVSDET